MAWLHDRLAEPVSHSDLVAIADFLLYSRSRPQVFEALRNRFRLLEQGYELAVRAFLDTSGAASDLDPTMGAQALLALESGLALRHLLDPDSQPADVLGVFLRWTLGRP